MGFVCKPEFEKIAPAPQLSETFRSQSMCLCATHRHYISFYTVACTFTCQYNDIIVHKIPSETNWSALSRIKYELYLKGQYKKDRIGPL